MKMINAVVAPHALDDVRRALERHAVLGMTICEVSGPSQDGPREVHRGVVAPPRLAPALRIEAIVHDELVERVLGEIERSVSGDGRMWVAPLDLVTRVRTGERGADAV